MKERIGFDKLWESLASLPYARRSLIVAISGFGGGGKSTLAARLCEKLEGAVVVSADDFTIDQQEERSSDWSSIDRGRLSEQVLEPAIAGQTIRYQRYDWPTNQLAEWREVGKPRCLIVEGIGILHPDLLRFFDLAVWIDLPLEYSNERGRFRDKEIYKVDHDAYWRDLWTPNDRDYFERFRPDQLADVIYEPG
jgi:uridine kinase